MNKKEAIERVRESIRLERIQRDQGDELAHDRIQYLTSIVCQLQGAKEFERVQSIIETYNINDGE